MKNFLLIICISLLYLSGYTQWTTLSSGTTNDLKSVYFPDVNTGYAAGSYGVILKTNDGGATWSQLSMGLNSHFNSVFFSDISTGYAVGVNSFNNGIIYKTIDAGSTWSMITNTIPKDLNSVYFPTTGTGYAVGVEGLIVKTTDAGMNWSVLTSGTVQHLNGVHFRNATVGCVVGNNGTILKTVDGGANWTVQSNWNPNHLHSVSFTNETVGFASGDMGTIIQTTNGGTSWSAENLYGTTDKLNSVFCTQISSGYYYVFSVGSNGKFLSAEQGVNWFSMPSGITNDLNSVFFCNVYIGYSVGDNGTILKTTNGGGIYSGESEFSDQTQAFIIYPNPVENYLQTELMKEPVSGSYIHIYNLTGQSMFIDSISNKSYLLNVGDFPKGMYVVIVSQNGKSFQRKFCKI